MTPYIYLSTPTVVLVLSFPSVLTRAPSFFFSLFPGSRGMSLLPDQSHHIFRNIDLSLSNAAFETHHTDLMCV